MIWIELRANDSQYDTGWNFTESIWAPTKKKGGGNWPYWNLVGDVIKGDLIFHILEKKGIKRFVGYSTAATDGYLTTIPQSIAKHPWSYTNFFFKADLTDYQELNPSIPLSEFFSNNYTKLTSYFLENKTLPKLHKKLLFYVIQNKRLQCQNGAYFSQFDSTLSLMLNQNLAEIRKVISTKVETDSVIKEIAQRIGHQEFSENVKENFRHKCCYPKCNIEGRGFLVSGHITRWADNKDLRGDTDNGLCFCLIHDKAFEKGYFTLNEDYTIILLYNKLNDLPWLLQLLKSGESFEIKPREISPSTEAIRNHWLRIGYQIQP